MNDTRSSSSSAVAYDLYVFKTTGSHNHIQTNELDYVKTRDDGDFLYEKYNNDNSYQLNAMVTYNNTFGKHDINALFVYEQYEGTTDWMDGQRNYFISSAVDQLFAEVQILKFDTQR